MRPHTCRAVIGEVCHVTSVFDSDSKDSKCEELFGAVFIVFGNKRARRES